MSQPVSLVPKVTEVEAAVLSAMTLSPAATDKGLAFPDKWFYHPASRVIRQAMAEIRDLGQAVDPKTLMHHLQKDNRLDQVGGASQVFDMFQEAVTATNMDYHGGILEDVALSRFMVQKLSGLTDRAAIIPPATDSVINDLMVFVEQVKAERTVQRQQGRLDDALDEWWENMEASIGQGVEMPTIRSDYNQITGGYQRQEITITGALPSHGKSALGLTDALHLAEQGLRCHIATYEMGERSMYGRLISMKSGVPQSAFRSRRKLADDEWRRLATAKTELSQLTGHLKIDFRPEPFAGLRRLYDQYQPDFCVIDYIQKMPIQKSDSRYRDLAETASMFQDLAKDYNASFLVLSQASRNLEKRESHIPMMSDLAESSGLEQAADIVSFLVFPEKFKEQTERGDDRMGTQYIVKGRDVDLGQLSIFNHNLRIVEPAQDKSEVPF